MTEPTDGLRQYQSFKRVLAGQITEVVAAGCYVKEKNGDTVLRIYPPNMTSRYQPKVGDFWVIYEDGYQAISPCQAFSEGYADIEICRGEPDDLAGKISHAINCHSAENGSDTPDFILADYLMDCLRAFDGATRRREQWYGRAKENAVDPEESPEGIER